MTEPEIDPRDATYAEQYGPRKEFEPMPPKPKVPRRLIPGGCQHTEDPAGWITDENGTITDRCNCGEVPAE